MTDRQDSRPRRGRSFQRTYAIPVGTTDYAGEQRQYHALAGHFRVLAYTTSPELLLKREAWLWSRLWTFARARQHERGPFSGNPRAVTGRNQREGTRLQYLRLAKVFNNLAQHPTPADFLQAERDAWQHVWDIAQQRGWLAPLPGDEQRTTIEGV